MCSRFTVTSSPEALRRLFQTHNILEFPPRFNIAPTQPVVIVRNNLKGEREMDLVRWGLIPSWVKDPREFTTLINARSESAAEKPSFRGALRHKRCLVPADGFYEWTGRRGSKQPHLVAPETPEAIAFAGLWEHWLGADGSEIETVAILTTAANGDVAKLHDRMPIVIEPKDFERWLDCTSGTVVTIKDLLSPPREGFFTIRAVSKDLNNPAHDGPDVQRAPEQGRLL